MTLKEIEDRLIQVEQMAMKTARLIPNVVDNLDDTSNKVEQITPYTDTKTAYIGDTEVVFTNVPQGNLSVYFDTPTDYSVERTKDAIAVTFDALDEVTTVTISIQ